MSSNVAVVQPARRAVPRLGRLLRILAVVLVIALVGGYFGLSAYMADKLSHPSRNLPEGTPALYGLTYREVTFNSTVDNIPLNGWYIDTPGDKVVLMMHGRDFSRTANGGLEKAAVLARHGYDVFMFDFRAHGLSGGERYGLGVWESRDVEGALAYLKSVGVNEVGAYGISMGAATELITAAKHPEMKALLSESSYAELMPVVEAALPKASGLPAFFNPGVVLTSRLLLDMDLSRPRPVDAVRSMSDRPVLLIHSVKDEMVPVEHAYQLEQAGASNPNLSIWILPDAAHCEGFSTHREEYTQRMLAFYDKYLK